MPEDINKARPEGGPRPLGREARREGKPEARREVAPETVEHEELGAESPIEQPTSYQLPVSAPPTKTPAVRAVEDILEQDLAEVYFELPRDKQAAFKTKGEEVTGKIVAVLDRARSQAKNILGWIRDWLRMIPGVNKFFLEQESKIKTDRIVAFSEKKKE